MSVEMALFQAIAYAIGFILKKWSCDDEFHNLVISESILRLGEGASQFVYSLVAEFCIF